MNYTLCLTNACNLRCRYCYVPKKNETMSFEVARKAVDLALASEQERVGIGLFGGEPMLCRSLIEQIVTYAEEQKSPVKLYFRMTTNGILLDETFLNFAKRNSIFIALSLDGAKAAHNKCRVTAEGVGSFEQIVSKVPMLLKVFPYAPAILVVSPETVSYFAESVEYLYGLGFRYILPSMHYAGAWDETSIQTLKGEYQKLSKFYLFHTQAEDKFYFSPFDTKIASHINREAGCSKRCELGKEEIFIDTDGAFYPCMEFVGKEEFLIGHIDTGIDPEKQNRLYELGNTRKEECADCALNHRCHHYCGCINMRTTGSLTAVAPTLCASEKILIPIADRLAERLYKKRNAMFIHKHYNSLYPFLSLIEDRT